MRFTPGLQLTLEQCRPQTLTVPCHTLQGWSLGVCKTRECGLANGLKHSSVCNTSPPTPSSASCFALRAQASVVAALSADMVFARVAPGTYTLHSLLEHDACAPHGPPSVALLRLQPALRASLIKACILP